MALYWPEAAFALELEGMRNTWLSGETSYPPDVLVLTVRDDQIDDLQFLQEMCRLIERRCAERLQENAADKAPGAKTAEGEKCKESPEDAPEGKIAGAAAEKDGDTSDGPTPDGLLDALLYEEALLASVEEELDYEDERDYDGHAQVQVFVNGCKELRVGRL